MTPLFDAGSMPISTVSTDHVVLADAHRTLAEAARLMAEADVGLVVVGTAERVEGVVSERDIVRVVAAGRDPASTTLREAAHGEVVQCRPTDTVAQVGAQMMREYVRHVVVEDPDGRLLGIVSARDLLGTYCAAESPPG